MIVYDIFCYFVYVNCEDFFYVLGEKVYFIIIFIGNDVIFSDEDIVYWFFVNKVKFLYVFFFIVGLLVDGIVLYFSKCVFVFVKCDG